jgi:hypothetical protein
VTEEEWLVQNPLGMIWHITQTAPASIRKLRLLAAAYASYLESQPDHLYAKPASASAEAVADGQRTLESAWAELNPPTGWDPSEDWFIANLALVEDERLEIRVRAAMSMSLAPNHGHPPVPEIDMSKRAALIRRYVLCILGNPFRPVAVDPSWLTSTVVQLAQGIYDDRAFDRLPILADALQDAGCDNTDVLNHCRDAGPHARGCWVVDMLLGKT